MQKLETLLSLNFVTMDERRWTGRALVAPLPARFRFGTVLDMLTPIRYWLVRHGDFGRMYTVFPLD